MITQRKHGQHMADRKIALMPLQPESEASNIVGIAIGALMAVAAIWFAIQFLR